MRFNPRARLDTSQVEDRTGGGAGGGGRRGGVPVRVGGGLGGLAVVVLIAIFAPDLLSGGGGGSTDQQGGSSSGDFSSCTTGEQANSSRECRLVAITDAVQGYWSDALPAQTGTAYREARTVPFTQSVVTGGCGQASSDTGPFYCPRDQRVYLDLSFFDTVLRQLGGQDSAFTEAYVVAHEYGHHIENLLGVLGRVRSQNGANSDAVRLETMADCLAGVWTKNATTVEDENGQVLIEDLTQRDVEDAIAAAKVVGDDAIQRRTSGRVEPEGWTHGSSAQRTAAFTVGMRKGSVAACNFFDPANRNYPTSR